MKTLIISDVHIGSKYCRESDLIEFLNSIEYDRLILAGDIIDFIKIPSFTERTIGLFSAINYEKDIVYIIGNHDDAFREWSGLNLFGISFVEKYEFKSGGRTIRVEHGDAYDRGILSINFLIKIISLCHDWLERRFNIDLATWYVDWKLKKRKLRRIWDILKWNDDVDVIIMGHAHCPEAIIWVNEDNKIKTYVNTGDWVAHTSYVLVDNGLVRLKQYDSKDNGD